MEWQRMNKQDQNLILKRHGFKWRKLEYEDTEEELTGWFLVGLDNNTWSLDRAFAHIAEVDARTVPVKAQSIDEDSPVVVDAPPDDETQRRHWLDHSWRWKRRGDGKWLLFAPGKQMVTNRMLNEASEKQS